jgi:DNA-binding CsgD family transcriptional regulator
MHALSQADWRLLERALAGLFAPGLSTENYNTRAFTALHALVPGDLLAVGCLKTKPRTLELSLSENVPSAPAALEALSHSMWKYRLHNWDTTVNGGKPFKRGDFYSRRQYRDLDVYEDTFRPLGLIDHFAIYVPGQEDGEVFFGVERGGRVEFSERDRTVLILLQPHLANARSLAWQRTKIPELSLETVLPRFCDAGMSPREAEVLYWILEGKANEEIAIILGLRISTVKTHLSSVFIKLNVENRLAAIRSALKLALRPQAFTGSRLTRIFHVSAGAHAGRRIGTSVSKS